MRISDFEKKTIVSAVQSVDKDASVWLFGSRTDDKKRGGDIDIAILSNKIKDDVMEEIKVRRFICDKIGEQQIDIVSSGPDQQSAFFKSAVKEGIKLN
ncbi:MAG: nucleotidyltransferase domain-containing protein [Treponema sp.]|jgi:predicted nucleotidyltransferase|nr:nucleotidyltransferase domain-containing protein [Treponema sp.]